MLPSCFPLFAFDLFADPWSFEHPRKPQDPQKQKIVEVRLDDCCLQDDFVRQ